MPLPRAPSRQVSAWLGEARAGASAGGLPPVRARSAAPGRPAARRAAGHADAAATEAGTFPLDFKRLETWSRSSARTDRPD